MGQSRTKVQKFLEQNPICIFCGGEKASTTQDHIPPRTLFIDRKWPEGFVFGACEACNNESSDAEYVAGILAKMTWNSSADNRLTKQRFDLIFEELKLKKPKIFHEMQSGLGAATKKRIARELGLQPENGQTYAELPLVSISSEFNDAIQLFGEKLAKALHYKHSGVIPPATTKIRLRWATNVNWKKGENHISEEDLKPFGHAKDMKRENSDLSDQFHYWYLLTEDGRNSAFQCVFSESFSVTAMLSFDNLFEES